jgi:hypothetical protein
MISAIIPFIAPAALSVNCSANTQLFTNTDPSLPNSIHCYSGEPHTTTISISPKMVSNIQKLSTISKLSPNWNGYDAPAFSLSLIDKIKSFLFRLSIQPSIFPTGRNSIQLEYEKENGDYLEFEVFPEKVIMLKIIGSDEVETEIDENQIPQMVDEFYGRV